jgi:hypothetical protein
MDTNNLSYFLVGLLASNNVIGSVDRDDVSIVHDASRLPSEGLVNMNRRAMGMKDFQSPIFLSQEGKEKRNRWEGNVRSGRRSGPAKLAVQDSPTTTKKKPSAIALRRQGSSSKLQRPKRRPASPNSPSAVLTIEGIGGRSATRNMHRWGSSSAIMCCVDEEVIMPAPKTTGLQKQSDSALVKPRREVRGLLTLQQTAIEELEEDEIALVSIVSSEVEVLLAGNLSESSLGSTTPENDPMTAPSNTRAKAAVVDDNEASLWTMDFTDADCVADSKDERNERSMAAPNTRAKAAAVEDNEASLWTMDFADADCVTDSKVDENERSMSIQDIELCCGRGNRRTESPQQRDANTGLGNEPHFFAPCNDSLSLLQEPAVTTTTGPRMKKQLHRRGRGVRPSVRTHTHKGSSALSVLAACIVNHSEQEDETAEKTCTKFLSPWNDSLSLVNTEAGSRMKHLSRGRVSSVRTTSTPHTRNSKPSS